LLRRQSATIVGVTELWQAIQSCVKSLIASSSATANEEENRIPVKTKDKILTNKNPSLGTAIIPYHLKIEIF
jgi:hypothetical protein